MGLVFAMLAVPLLTGLIAWKVVNPTPCERLQLTGSFLTLMITLSLAYQVLTRGAVSGWNEWIYVDAFSVYNLSLIVVVSFTASLYSVGYMRYELQEGAITRKQFHRFYLWFHLFIFTMLLVSIVNNLGLLWVGIELSTLVSAFLVAFYNKGTSLEAAWKYLIMGSVGIAFALLGIIFLYISGIGVFGEHPHALNWTTLRQAATQLNPQWIAVAFLFVLVGLGTKTGLAPMHFWLPDAHSQAPTPVSAVLSGVLLNTALYGILRIYSIANLTLNGGAGHWLILFGLLSIGITVPFILVQHDLKRMLAYSSVEHMGVITLGVGIGGPLGLYGGLLHMLNHSMAKSLLFFTAGNINQTYHSKRIDRISGLIRSLPFTGSIFLLSVFAVTGTPPFNLFLSEFTIMVAGFKEGHFWATLFFLLCVLLIFAGMVYYTIKMAFGETPQHLRKKEISRWSEIALLIPFCLVVLFGLHVPSFVSDTIHQATVVLQGVRP